MGDRIHGIVKSAPIGRSLNIGLVHHAIGKVIGARYNQLSTVWLFLQRFDELVRDSWDDRSFLKDKDWALWRHLDLVKVYRETSRDERDRFRSALPGLRVLVSDYLGNTALPYPFLDWLLLDALTACSVVDCTEMALAQK